MIADDSWQRCTDQLYHEWHGWYVLEVLNRDLFGFPIIGGGYRPLRRLEYDEALTFRCSGDESLRIVAPEKGVRG